jgi:DNA-binding transcriptional MerR regulator
MRDLVRLSGVARSTIQFYERERLLPPREKRGQTSMLYREDTVERLRTIRRLQAEERLTLEEIRRVLALVEKGGDAGASLRLMKTMGPLRGSAPVVDRPRLAQESGLSLRSIAQALRLGLLSPTAKDGFDREDLDAARVMAELLSLGGRLEELAFYREHGERIVKHELALRDRLIQGLGMSQAIRVTEEVTVMAKQIRAYLLQRILFEKAVIGGKR